MCGSDSSAPPPPTAQELELMDTQTDLIDFQIRQLEEQSRRDELLFPLLLEELNLRPVFEDTTEQRGEIQTRVDTLTGQRDAAQTRLDELVAWQQGKKDFIANSANPEINRLREEISGFDSELGELEDQLARLPESGRIVGFEDIPLTEEEQARQDRLDALESDRLEIEGALLDRQKKALAGELDIDPGLTRRLDEQEEELRESLRARLGSGFETSTPGIEAMAEFNKRKEELLTAASRGELTLASQLALAEGGFREQVGSTDFGELLSRIQGTSGVVDSPFGTTSGIAQAIQGAQIPIGNMQFERQLRFQAEEAARDRRAQVIAGLGQGAGQVAGAFALRSIL